jgi:hypothetical protein
MKTAPLALLTAILLPAACAPGPASAPQAGLPAAAAPEPASTLAAARAADAQGPGKLERVDTVGEACGDSAASSISPDGQAFTTIFSDFVAAAGPNTPPEQASRGCLLLVRVDVPAGWQYSIESLDYRGFASLQDDVTASRSTFYVISGSDARSPDPVELEGPFEEDFNHADVGPDAPSGWSRCGEGQNLWIAARAEVDNSEDDDNEGFLALDSVDGEVQWRRCD